LEEYLGVLAGIAGVALVLIFYAVDIFRNRTHPSDNKKYHRIDAYKGTYRGLSPTDESAIQAGEIELIITDEVIRCRMATGHMIAVNEVSTADIFKMTEDELGKVFIAGSPLIKTSTGFRTLKGSPRFIFLQADDNKGHDLLLFHGGMVDEVFGPATLSSSPQQFKEMVAKIEATYGKVMPRLHLNGRAPGR
jgi:hypothetical protein